VESNSEEGEGEYEVEYDVDSTEEQEERPPQVERPFIRGQGFVSEFIDTDPDPDQAF
jgi:hypothetical protein